MIYFIDNKDVLTSDRDVFSYYSIGLVGQYAKPFNNSILSDVSFYIDIQDYDKLPDEFYIKFLGNNNLILGREHQISVVNFASKLVEKIKQYNLDTRKIYIILAHNQQAQELEDFFAINGIQNVNVLCSMIWLCWPIHCLERDKFEYNDAFDKKFSIFSRRYVDWRRNLYLDLLINDILPDCHYTFSNLHPDFDDPKSLEQMMTNLPTYMEEHKSRILDWFQMQQPSYDFQDPFARKISYLLQDSAINIALETHIIDQQNGVTLTEKTYKPILLKRPFLVYGIPNILSMLHKEGFRTFDGIIDETYDNIKDEHERRKAIITEIKRINSLSSIEFEGLLSKCRSICQYNLEVVDHYKKRNLPISFTNQSIFGSK